MTILQGIEQLQRKSKPLGLRVKPRLASLFRRRRKLDFLNRLPRKFEVLDVGCGLDSPYLVKSLFPDCTYTGSTYPITDKPKQTFLTDM